ncbi:sensor histidine kinase [Polaribacter reichenbachii]|uniref:sensor histidine kinase n=1 Tax=Polaribacter reichenbachii TaxID=996801 RepID=UPI0009F1D4D5|nr:sensor histidine kinase [Polaribacter reichenbachii]
MKLLLNFTLLLFSIVTIAQNTLTNIKDTYKVEDFILHKKLDSAKHYLAKLEQDSYYNILEKLVKKQELTYREYYIFTSKLSNRQSVKYQEVSEYINENVLKPADKNINLDYFEIIWIQVYKLRDEISIDEAAEKQKELEAYIYSFNQSDRNVIKAKLKSTTHPIVMYQIQGDVENGKKLCLDGLQKSEELEDKELQIIFLYYLSDFLILEGKLQEYIDVCKKSLLLENQLQHTSSYYFSTIENLINAYVYKRGHNDEVIELINILYEEEDRRIHTYSLYAQLIASLDKNSSLKKQILQKFDVTNVKDLVAKFRGLGKDLNSNDTYSLLNFSSYALSAHDYKDLALSYKDLALQTIKKTYSKELSESLANFKTDIAIKEKQKEVELEKVKTKLYAIIAILAFVLFIITLLVLRKIKKQSKELKDKNVLIEKTLQEKELLVKEVHHRVKNNFQIVSSLLELQTKGIEDERALELANEGQNRVKSMALIHQKLYQNESGLIDFDEYIRVLIKELSSMYASKTNVETLISSKNVMFDVDTAIPLGLIINEIITNSYKYAFKSDKKNSLLISLEKEENKDYKLIIEDNGPGLSTDINVKKAKSLGLRLVNRLVKQLHGTLKQTNSKGAKFEIYFKDIHQRQLVN